MYDILKAEEYEKNGEKKTAFHKVGVAFDNRNGDGFTIKLPLLNLTLIAKKSKPKDQVQKADDSSGDEMPF